jgi:hypothetical protein
MKRLRTPPWTVLQAIQDDVQELSLLVLPLCLAPFFGPSQDDFHVSFQPC